MLDKAIQLTRQVFTNAETMRAEFDCKNSKKKGSARAGNYPLRPDLLPNTRVELRDRPPIAHLGIDRQPERVAIGLFRAEQLKQGPPAFAISLLYSIPNA